MGYGPYYNGRYHVISNWEGSWAESMERKRKEVSNGLQRVVRQSTIEANTTGKQGDNSRLLCVP